MAIGVTDYIDQLLVQKYSLEKVDNHESMVSAVEPEKMMSALNDHASMSRNMFLLNQTLKNSCSAIKSRNVQYRKAEVMEGYQSQYVEDRSVA